MKLFLCSFIFYILHLLLLLPQTFFLTPLFSLLLFKNMTSLLRTGDKGFSQISTALVWQNNTNIPADPGCLIKICGKQEASRRIKCDFLRISQRHSGSNCGWKSRMRTFYSTLNLLHKYACRSCWCHSILSAVQRGGLPLNSWGPERSGQISQQPADLRAIFSAALLETDDTNRQPSAVERMSLSQFAGRL